MVTSGAFVEASVQSGECMPPSIIAALNEFHDAAQSEMKTLEEQRKTLHAQKSAVSKQIRLKKKRDERLLAKAAKNLSPEAMMLLASRKMASRAKAKARANARDNGRSS